MVCEKKKHKCSCSKLFAVGHVFAHVANITAKTPQNWLAAFNLGMRSIHSEAESTTPPTHAVNSSHLKPGTLQIIEKIHSLRVGLNKHITKDLKKKLKKKTVQPPRAEHDF